MSKFISKQSVAIWYALTALLATFLVGQVILWFFPDRSSMGASLLFILMNCIPLIMAAVFSLVLREVKSLGEFFKKVFLQKESPLSWILAIFIPVISSITRTATNTKLFSFVNHMVEHIRKDLCVFHVLFCDDILSSHGFHHLL